MTAVSQEIRDVVSVGTGRGVQRSEDGVKEEGGRDTYSRTSGGERTPPVITPWLSECVG